MRPIAEAPGWPAASYSTVYAVLQQSDPTLVMPAQEGSKVYRDRFDLLYRRDTSRPNEIWQADHIPPSAGDYIVGARACTVQIL